jgi:uncharacterized membrane protein
MASDGYQVRDGGHATDLLRRALRARRRARAALVSLATGSSKPAAQLHDLADLAAIVVAVGLAGLVVEGGSGIARVLLALAFASFVPGRAVVSNWPRLARWSEFGMSVVLSLAIMTLVAMVALWAHAWHPLGLFLIEAVLSAMALVAGMLRRHQRAGDETASE